jgi:hypothetical protein
VQQEHQGAIRRAGLGDMKRLAVRRDISKCRLRHPVDPRRRCAFTRNSAKNDKKRDERALS